LGDDRHTGQIVTQVHKYSPAIEILLAQQRGQCTDPSSPQKLKHRFLLLLYRPLQKQTPRGDEYPRGVGYGQTFTALPRGGDDE